MYFKVFLFLVMSMYVEGHMLGPEESIGSSGAEVTCGCDMGSGINSVPVQEQKELSIAKTFVWPLYKHYSYDKLLIFENYLI